MALRKVFVQLFLLVVVIGRAAEIPSESNGLKLTVVGGYHAAILSPVVLVDETGKRIDPVTKLPPEPKSPDLRFTFEPYLENVGKSPVTVLTKPERFEGTEDRGPQVVFGFSVEKVLDHTKSIKPSIYRFEPVTLNPGEITALPPVIRFQKAGSPKPTSPIFFYFVTKELGEMLGAWSGHLRATPVKAYPDKNDQNTNPAPLPPRCPNYFPLPMSLLNRSAAFSVTPDFSNASVIRR